MYASPLIRKDSTRFPCPKIMGILNVTPDSFYSASRSSSLSQALAIAKQMEADGADWLDVGGESTRPGSSPVSFIEEKERVIPVIQAIREVSDINISVDTRKAAIATLALDAGANMVNDISALSYDSEMSAVVAQRGVPIVLMHARETPQTMQDNPFYVDTFSEVKAEIADRIEFALASGIRQEQIIIDPGIGFAKRCSDNLILIRNLSQMCTWGFPVLVGLSRKSFIGDLLNTGQKRSPEERLGGSLAGAIVCSMAGAEYIRVHDVRETFDMFRILNTIESPDQDDTNNR